MTAYFLDSSALVKRYVDESGSDWVRALCDARVETTQEKLNLVAIADIAIVEVSAAFSLLARTRTISKSDSDFAYRKFISEFQFEYSLVYAAPDQFLIAAELTRRHPLKAYDAIQLALALKMSATLQANELSLIFATSDKMLLQAAGAEGLRVENPSDHG